MLAASRAKVSQREIAVAYWGAEEVARHWEPDGWMRGRVRYKLERARRIEKRRRDAAAD